MKISSSIIKLNDIRLHGSHGISAEERKVGSDFILNIILHIPSNSDAFCNDSLENSINYADAYKFVEEEFKKTSDTLENVAYRIADRLFKEFPILEEAEIEVNKLNPPFSADCYAASVTIKACQ